MIRLGDTDLDVFPLALGGNVFGWSANEAESFAVLDAYVAAGGNFIDTADIYSSWVPGNSGGESEAILGRWMRARGNRDQLVIGTKVGLAPFALGLSRETIRRAVALSLERLQTDRIDLYYAHKDDPQTPLPETLGTFDALVREGKIRHIAASQYSAPRLAEALAVSRDHGFARYAAFQTHYSLLRRTEYEHELAQVCMRERVACLPFYSLARGFLTGKYRPGRSIESVRAEGIHEFMDERGLRVLSILDELAAAHDTTVAAVTLAWTARQPGIAVPLASARTPAQLAELLPFVNLALTADELGRLSSASA